MSPAKTALVVGERVRLVPADDSMVEQFQSWVGDTDTRHLIGGAAYPISMEAEREFIRGRQQVGWDSGVFMAVEAIDRPEPLLIGSVELRHFHAEARLCDVGILIGDPAHRGGGYGTEAMRLACRFAFEEVGMERVELSTFDFNTRAVRSYEKVGFVVEGRKRRAAYLGGRYYDEIMMGLLREEFQDGPRDEVHGDE
jgi:RimJ/RimL family protein N-acetyltransferase